MSKFFVDKIWYFITVSTNDHFPFFFNPKDKQIIVDRIKSSCKKLGIDKYYFSIMSNHYHLLAFFENGTAIPKLMNLVQGGSSFLLMRELGNKDKPIWDDYYLRIPKDEKAFEMIKGYVIGNPLKHKEVKNFEELASYPFSSFAQVIQEEGKEKTKILVESSIIVSDIERP